MTKTPDLKIDPNRLPEHWQDQATMMLHWSTKQAHAQAKWDTAANRLKVVESELELDIRSNPAQYDLGKVTEATVQAAVHDTAQWQDAADAVVAARHDTNLARAVVDALSHRKAALQGLSDLWLRQYYADPTTPAQPQEVRDAADTDLRASRGGGRKPRQRGPGT